MASEDAHRRPVMASSGNAGQSSPPQETGTCGTPGTGKEPESPEVTENIRHYILAADHAEAFRWCRDSGIDPGEEVVGVVRSAADLTGIAPPFRIHQVAGWALADPARCEKITAAVSKLRALYPSQFME